MNKIQKYAQYMRDSIFRRLEAPRRNYEKTMINDMDNLYGVIRKGDVILVEGNSEISRMIKLLTQSSWSHSAIYVGDELVINGDVRGESLTQQFGDDARHMLVEAFTGTGVTAAPVRKYKDFNIRVCRPYGISARDIDSVVSEVSGHLGKQYDHRNIIDLGLMLLPPFLNPFKKRTIHACLGNCNEFQVICSGMIAKAFQRVGYPIIPALDPIPINSSSKRHNPYGASLIMRHYSQVMPKHFDISPNFQIIKFNIIEGGEFNYKALWSRTIFETRHPNRLSPKKRGEPAVIDDNLLPLSR
jgi:cell wall-associated NlpC family hydrolase